MHILVASKVVSTPQLEFLAQCMEQFPSLALSNLGKSREERGCAKKKWHHIGSALNKIKPGVTKTGARWLRYWAIYKYGLRKKYPQFKVSWVRKEPVLVTPLERRFLRVLSDCEKKESPDELVDQNAEICQSTHEGEKGALTTNNPQEKISKSTRTKQETSQSMPTKHETSEPMLTKQETSQPMPTKQETSQPMSTILETSQLMPTMQIVDVCRERELESPVQDDDDNEQDDDDNKQGDDDDDDKHDDDDDYKSIEHPIETEKEAEKERIQVEMLKFNLKRQRELHELEMEHMKELHELELEILQLKKKKLLRACDRNYLQINK